MGGSFIKKGDSRNAVSFAVSGAENSRKSGRDSVEKRSHAAKVVHHLFQPVQLIFG